MTNRICVIPGCGALHEARGWCKRHYLRWFHTGTVLSPCETCGNDCDGRAKFCSDECRPVCVVAGCQGECRTRGWCQTHYSQILRVGRISPLTYSLSDPRLCVVCGATDWPPNGRRKNCSANCEQILSRNGGQPPPLIRQCARCTTIIDLSVRHPSGRKTRADIKICAACHRAKYTRHRMSVTELADRDGDACGICSDLVDMSLVFPDLFRASVDHIVPYAHGGSHDPSNLQLAHLWCNYVKSDRANFVI